MRLALPLPLGDRLLQVRFARSPLSSGKLQTRGDGEQGSND
ncbi:hypothetical protein V5G28_000960 [Scytonema sp. PRP1]